MVLEAGRFYGVVASPLEIYKNVEIGPTDLFSRRLFLGAIEARGGPMMRFGY